MGLLKSNIALCRIVTGAESFPWQVVFFLFDQLSVCLVYRSKTTCVLFPLSPTMVLTVPLVLIVPLSPFWHILGSKCLQNEYMDDSSMLHV